MREKNEIEAIPDDRVESRVRTVASLREGDKGSLHRSIGRYLADRSPRVRSAALDVVREEQLRHVDASVLQMLADKSDIVRQAAVECFGVLHEGEAVEASWLCPLLKDPSSIVRIETVESLAQIGDRAALPLIAESLEDDDPLVRGYAARSIAVLQGYDFVPAIERAFKSERDDNAKVGYADALLTLGDSTGFPVLVGLLSSSDYRVRCASANALSAASLTPVQLQSALAAVAYAAQHSLTAADRSTMERVERELYIKGVTGDSERRDKPAHCRGRRSPTEKEKRPYSGLESCL